MSTSSQPNYDLSRRIDARVAKVISDWNLTGELFVFDSSTASASDAARTLSVEVAQIGKSIAFRGDDSFIVVLIAGSLRVDKGKLRIASNSKRMASIDGDALELGLGYKPGGLSPLYLPEGARLFVDKSVEDFETVYVSAGTSNSVVALSKGMRERIFGRDRFDLSVEVAKGMEDS